MMLCQPTGQADARTHKSAFCKRGSVNVRFAPKATEVLRCRELTRCANCCLTPPLRLIVLLFARTGCKSARCQRLSENPA